VVQHIDRGFVAGLAEWLAGFTPLPVRLAEEGERITPGVIHIAVSGNHLVLRPDRCFAYTPEPRDNPFRPSVDVFFASVAAHWPRPSVAVLLTGMGRDGADGLLALRRRRWHTIAQDESTSTVYGMPKAAAEAGAAVEVLPLPRIAAAILAQISPRSVS